MDLVYQTEKRLKESRLQKLKTEKGTIEYKKLEKDIRYFNKLISYIVKMENTITY